jgi:hypothetical protein
VQSGTEVAAADEYYFAIPVRPGASHLMRCMDLSRAMGWTLTPFEP